MSDAMQPYVNLDRRETAPMGEPRPENLREPLAPETASPEALAQEVEVLNPDGYVTTELAGEIDGEAVVADVVALMPGKWKSSAMRLLRGGDFDAFFALILTAESYDAYLDLDPNQEQIEEFVTALSAKARESVGKSSGRRGSATRMRRR